MGFVYLSIVVIAITTTALIAKMASLRKVSPLELATALFGVSTALGLVFLWPRLPMPVPPVAIVISAIAGAGGAMAVLAFNSAVGLGHFGYSNAIYRASFLVPVVYAVLFLGSVLKLTTVVGIVLILAGIFLMSFSTTSPDKGRTEFRWIVLILAAFLLSGAPRVGQSLTSLHKVDYFLYLFLSYLAGALVLLGFVGIRRSFKMAALPWGAGAAVASYAGVFCTLKALETLKPQVVFPISLSGPIVLGVVLSLLAFREKIRPSGWIGIVCGTAGITILAIWK